MGDPEAPQAVDQSTKPITENDDEEAGQENGAEDEEVGECGFCLFMKGGGCKDAFIAWENCIQDAESNNEDIVEKCFEVTGALKKCMEAHPDYYEPILQAEKDQEEETRRRLAEEKVPSTSETNVSEKEPENAPSESESNVSDKEPK